MAGRCLVPQLRQVLPCAGTAIGYAIEWVPATNPATTAERLYRVPLSPMFVVFVTIDSRGRLIEHKVEELMDDPACFVSDPWVSRRNL